MRGAIWLLCLAILPLQAADTPPDAPGPRVTIQADAVPLEQILTGLAKQLNRRFVGYIPTHAPSLRELQSLSLQHATIPELKTALWDLTGATMTRATPTNWSLSISRELPVQPLAVQVDDWDVQLTWLRYYYYRYVWPADPATDQMVSMLTPFLTFQAIDGVRALRLLGIGEAGATAADGEPIPARQKAATSAAPGTTDPATLTASPTLNAPGPEVKRLANIWVDLRFAERLEVTKFVFEDLDQPEQQRQREGSVTAVLAARDATAKVSPGSVTVVQALPQCIDPKVDTPVLRRAGWVEGRFYDADGEPLLTETRLVSFDAKSLDDQKWITRWQCSESVEPWVGNSVAIAGLPAQAKPPARLELICYRPAGQEVTRRVTFEDLPMPPRERDEP